MNSNFSSEGRILIAENEQIVALDLESQLADLGYRIVGLTRTGLETLDLADAARPDLVLMNIRLDGAMDGIETAKEIRSRWQIPVVFVTASVDEALLARAKTSGPYGYLTKPFHYKDLDATVAIALQQHRTTREIFIEHGWLHTLLSGMSDGVIATDVNGRLKYLNPVAESLTGWKLTEALDHSIEEVYPLSTEAGRPLDMCQVRRVLATGQSVPRQRFLLATRNSPIVVDDSAAPIRDAQGHLTGAVTVIVDVTEQQRSERERERLMKELERSNLELARFSHAVSHDLQTPVRTIRSFAELLFRRLEETSTEVAELVNYIMDAADGMHALIRSLLSFAQAGQGHLQLEMVSGSEVIRSVKRLLASLIAETGAQVESGPLPVVLVDRAQFAQLLQNLISNALRYRQPGLAPRISVMAEKCQDEWQFAVTDNGEGIAIEHAEVIFEPLRRLHGNEVPGSGIGLALCQAIVERHRGRIWVKSSGLGCGSTFYFTIPQS